MKNIILASKSPYRKELLLRLGIDFQALDSGLDESYYKEKIKVPQELTEILAKNKALNLLKLHKDSIIIGSDQVCYFDGKILGKTGCLEKSLDQLMMMQGKTHELFTSYAILTSTKEIIRTSVTKLKMRKLNESQVKNYLIQDNPIDCAGSYKLELKGISLMESITTEDYTGIIGLPLTILANDLNSLSIMVPPEMD